jgi:hypothetical protein
MQVSRRAITTFEQIILLMAIFKGILKACAVCMNDLDLNQSSVRKGLQPAQMRGGKNRHQFLC